MTTTVEDRYGVWEVRDIAPGRIERTLMRPSGVVRESVAIGGGMRLSTTSPNTSTITAPAVPREELPSAIPPVVLDGPRFTVHLAPHCMDVIERECEAVRQELGAAESGGWLYRDHRLAAAPYELYVDYATGPGPDAEHGQSAVNLTRHRDMEDAFPDGLRENVVRIGSWHSHPADDDAWPSSTDLRSARAGFELADGEPFVMVIVTERMYGYVVHDDAGEVVCSVATVLEG